MMKNNLIHSVAVQTAVQSQRPKPKSKLKHTYTVSGPWMDHILHLYPFQTGRISKGAPGCTRWNSSVWKVLADELPVNTDETPMNFWAKVTHLDPYSLIESSSVFNGGSRGRNPVWKASRWTPMKMPMNFRVLQLSKFIRFPRARARTHTHTRTHARTHRCAHTHTHTTY